MADLRLHLKLERCTGVLAGIVATLSRNGVELISQRIEADDGGGRGGVLALHAQGPPPDVDALVERLRSARGVDRVTWMEIDGETVLSEPEALADPIGTEDLARLSAGASSAGGTRPAAADAEAGATAPPPESKATDVSPASPGSAPEPDAGGDPMPTGAYDPDPESERRESEGEAADGDGLGTADDAAAGDITDEFESESGEPFERPDPTAPAPGPETNTKRRSTSLRRRRRRRL